ncbi:SDR family NAD(P)-dependent oxidoreductase, partial [Mesorhizobium sp. M7D.F.Ca.US.004.03.1.1]|uniref:SDR family NAD(P)-dependent oxidoreductase n=1 Tax=Mesorhizobium sp. M7D.F.Ca.US.004.03.1.1 TaxID=2496702 RepID=UPI000FCA64FF
MDLGLNGKVALVLGGGGGLGGAIAQTLAREGASVAVADIAMDAAVKTVASIEGASNKAMALGWDL